MKRSRLFTRSAAAVLVAFAAGAYTQAASAQTVDQTEITFWQTIQNSQNAAEYQVYLQLYPNGVFAEIARLRIQQHGEGGAPQPSAAGQQPAAAAQQAAPTATIAPRGPITDIPRPGGVVSDATISVEPPTARVGQQSRSSSGIFRSQAA